VSGPSLDLPNPARTAPATWSRVVQVMGLPVSLALRGRHAGGPTAEAAWADATASLREADRVFSTYRDDSFVSRLGRGELRLADCPTEVAEVLALGEQARLESGGASDVHREGDDGDVQLDPSGVVKGWAVQRAAQHLVDLPDTDVCLGGGGDLVCHLADPDAPTARPWNIGVEDPHQPGRLVATIPLARGAVATSSATHRGQHIVDARTGRPPTSVASVTVTAADLVWADIDATAAYALGRDALTWLRSRPGRSGVVVWSDGSAETFATG